MKKLSQFLLIAFSLVFMLSCNKDEDAKPTNTTTGLTTAEKLELLNNYKWLITKPVAAASNLTSNMVDQNPCNEAEEYFVFDAVSNVDGTYSGKVTLHSIDFDISISSNVRDNQNAAQSEVSCTPEKTTVDYIYYPATNKIFTSIISSDDSEDISTPKTVTIIITNDTIKIDEGEDEQIYYKGALIKR